MQQVGGGVDMLPLPLDGFAPASSASTSGNGGKGLPPLPLRGHAKGRPSDDGGVHRTFRQRVHLFLDLPSGGGGATTAVGAVLAVSRLSSTQGYSSRYRRERSLVPDPKMTMTLKEGVFVGTQSQDDNDVESDEVLVNV